MKQLVITLALLCGIVGSANAQQINLNGHQTYPSTGACVSNVERGLAWSVYGTTGYIHYTAPLNYTIDATDMFRPDGAKFGNGSNGTVVYKSKNTVNERIKMHENCSPGLYCPPLSARQHVVWIYNANIPFLTPNYTTEASVYLDGALICQ